MKKSVFASAMLGAMTLLVAVPAAALAPSLLVLPVDAPASETASGAVFDLALRNALEANSGLAVAKGEPILGELTGEQVRAAAGQSGADAVLAGSLENGSVALELRSGHSGGLITGWSIDAAADDLKPVVREIELVLASQSGAADSEAGDAATAGTAAGDESIVAGLRSDGPIEIRSDQLDVATRDGRRHLVFRRNVIVEQGDLELRCSKLDAYYAEGDSQPERLVAHGDVEVFQGERVAYCDVATYLRSDQKVVCEGHARLVQGCDVVLGEQLEFDLEREHFRVTGAASVVIGQGDEVCPSAAGRNGS